jgi:HEAT repeat protein
LNQIALGDFDNIEAEEASVEPLLCALKIGPTAVRVNVARTFERLQNRMQDPRIIAPLIRALEDSEPALRAAAAHALGNNTTDDQKISPLLKAFKDEASVVRAAAAEAIGKIGKPEHIPNFLPLIKDDNFEVRIATIKALRDMKSPEALDPIISALKDSDTDVRKCAVESLARLRDPRSVGALLITLIDKESVVRHAVANALQVINCDWQIGDEAQKAIPFFEAALKDDEYWVREAATKALYRIKNL